MVIISMLFNISGTMGPSIGGFLTDTFSWHWLFLVNIVPGLLVASVVWLAIDVDKPDFSLLHAFDVTGLVLMAIFLGCLQYALEEGPRWDWLDEQTIRGAIIVSAVGAAGNANPGHGRDGRAAPLECCILTLIPPNTHHGRSPRLSWRTDTPRRAG